MALSIPGCIPGITALKNSAALVIRILVTRGHDIDGVIDKL